MCSLQLYYYSIIGVYFYPVAIFEYSRCIFCSYYARDAELSRNNRGVRCDSPFIRYNCGGALHCWYVFRLCAFGNHNLPLLESVKISLKRIKTNQADGTFRKPFIRSLADYICSRRGVLGELLCFDCFESFFVGDNRNLFLL